MDLVDKIVKKNFDRENNGYKAQEVDDFLDEVCDDIEKMQKNEQRENEIAENTTVEVVTKSVEHGWVYTLFTVIAMISIILGLVLGIRALTTSRRDTDYMAALSLFLPFFFTALGSCIAASLVGKLEEIIFYLKRADERAMKQGISRKIHTRK